MTSESNTVDDSYIERIAQVAAITSKNDSNHLEANYLLRGLSFFLIPPIDDGVISLITKLGGEVLDGPRKGVIVLAKFNAHTDARFSTVYSYDFIYDSFNKKSLQDQNKYAIKRVYKASDIKLNLSKEDEDKMNKGQLIINKEIFDNNDTDNINGRRKSRKFTKQEDDYILDLVRRNPNLRSTHSFFERISQFVHLAGHTGNSIRYRYRRILYKRMNYYYLVDPLTNELKIDPLTNEPIKVEDEPALLKSQYTANEDYHLCKEILDYQNGKIHLQLKRKADPSSIPEIVFQNLASKLPRHSLMSWRDRYRKFATKYGLQNYVDYYDKCLKDGIIPNPMKNLSSRSDRKLPKPLSNQVIVDDEVDDNHDIYEENDHQNKISDNKNNNNNNNNINNVQKPPKKKLKLSRIKIEDPNLPSSKPRSNTNSISNSTTISSPSSVAEAALAAVANIAQQEHTISKPKKQSKKKSQTLAPYVKTENNENFHDDTPISSGANLFEEATEEEIKRFEAEVEVEVEVEEGARSESEINKNELSDHLNKDQQDNKDDDGLMDFKQLIEIDPEPLKNRELLDINSLVDNVTLCFERFVDDSPYDLFKDINDNTGLSMLWLTYWFDCSCGMLPTFNDAIIHYLKTGELILQNVPGFWTEKDDELLKHDPNNEHLLRLHGEDSVEKRKTVFFNFA